MDSSASFDWFERTFLLGIGCCPGLRDGMGRLLAGGSPILNRGAGIEILEETSADKRLRGICTAYGSHPSS